MKVSEAVVRICCGPPHINQTDNKLCIAGACMAWRWDWNDRKVNLIRHKDGGEYFTSKSANPPPRAEIITVCDTGYCGLAGPEYPE